MSRDRQGARKARNPGDFFVSRKVEKLCAVDRIAEDNLVAGAIEAAVSGLRTCLSPHSANGLRTELDITISVGVIGSFGGIEMCSRNVEKTVRPPRRISEQLRIEANRRQRLLADAHGDTFEHEVVWFGGTGGLAVDGIAQR